MDGGLRKYLLKERYLGEFKYLKELKLELNLDEGEIKSIEYMENISNYYKKKILMGLPAVAKWDIKGKELYEELSKKLCKVFKQDDTGINLNIVDSVTRKDLKNSYCAGKKFKKSQKGREKGANNFPIKFAVWDYLAGMTDNYIIEEYASLTFKHVEIG